MDIVSRAIWESAILNHVARAILGHATSGVSVGGDGSRIHLNDPAEANQRRASDIFNHEGSLSLSCDSESIVAGAPDPVISCADSAIAYDSQLAYLVMRDGDLHAHGQAPVIKGSWEFRLTKPAPGAWDIVAFRLKGNHASGSVNIAVAEK